MGYELNIQRPESNLITTSEWTDYISNDPDFIPIEEFSGKTSDGIEVSVSTPNAGLWRKNELEVPFTFQENLGQITVKNPDDAIIKKMIEIAKKLNGKVYGEEGEEYGPSYFDNQSKPILKKKWWKF